MYQMTDAAFAEARRYCIRHHTVVEDGCWFDWLYTRVVSRHAVELTAVFLDRNVAAIFWDIVGWSTRARGRGIWAPGGISSDGRALFVATGNTLGARTWSDGEAVFKRCRIYITRSGRRISSRRPIGVHLDERDADLGGSNPLPFDAPSPTGPQPVILALGKDARAYLLDRNNLDGIRGSLVSEAVSTRPIRTAPAAYPVADSVFVAFQGEGAHCPSARSDKI